MQDVKNASGKLVCRLDRVKRVVEIAHKGCKTVIRFYDGGRIGIVNYPEKAA